MYGINKDVREDVEMEKKSFLTKVAEVMKGMISHESMMASIQRSCMRAESENIALMSSEEENVDRFISGVAHISFLDVPESALDVLVLRYLKNTQFLATIKEDNIDVSGLEGGDLSLWKKTMLYKAP
jgi:ABC-type protease/lipase transport system fused ATPase/permease subunit